MMKRIDVRRNRARHGGLPALLGLLFLALPAQVLAAEAPEIFPLDELRPGMRAEVRTVIAGNEQETLEVEIIGTLEGGIGPGIPLVLGRFVDERGRWTGVAGGMSGSPVTIEGRLLGALSYSIGAFSKEPICGITPIGTMLALEDYPAGLLPWGSVAAAAPQARPFPLALFARGVSPAAAGELERSLSELGLRARVETSLAAGGPIEKGEAHLQPGDPVAALLVWGDLSLGATGTVSWRDGDELLAFGHPFLGTGRVSMPLAPAEIVWTVPSELNSFKISNIGEPVGAIDQDRLTAIRGRIGAAYDGVAIDLSVRREGAPEARYDIHVMRDPLITPVLVPFAVGSVLLDSLGAERDEALVMHGSLILDDGRALPLRASGPTPGSAAAAMSSSIARVLSQVMQAPARLEIPGPERVKLEIVSSAPGGGWSIVRALPDSLAVAPGDKLSVLVDLEGPRGLHRREKLTIEVPETALRGEYQLHVASERDLASLFGSLDEAQRRTARSKEAYLEALAVGDSTTRLVARLALPAEGIVTEGGRYPALPGSAHILLRSRPGGNEIYRSRWLGLAEASTELGRTLSGGSKVEVQITPHGAR